MFNYGELLGMIAAEFSDPYRKRKRRRKDEDAGCDDGLDGGTEADRAIS